MQYISKKERKRRTKKNRSRRKGQWKTIFDAKPMAEGMPPQYLLKLLNSQKPFVRHGKLLTASLWLQSQMVGAICLHDSPELRNRCTIDNGRHLPMELGKATIRKLETLSSETLRREFARCFGSSVSERLQDDLARAPLCRDALSHGYLSLRQQIIGPQPEGVFWSPRSSRERSDTLRALYGLRPEGTFLIVSLSREAFMAEIERISIVMGFIALKLTDWYIPYPVFA